MEYKGVEYSVVQLLEGMVGDGKSDLAMEKEGGCDAGKSSGGNQAG